jgi:precorrin-6x reductase
MKEDTPLYTRPKDNTMKTTNTFITAEQTGKAQTRTSARMEAIAWGVQARLEESTGYTKKVTVETINIARSLGVPISEIERWVNSRNNRLAYETEKIREIKTLLSKAEKTRFATA